MKCFRRRWFPVRYRRTSPKKRRKSFAFLALGIAALWCGLSEWGLSFVSADLAQEAAKNYLISCMNRAVEEECEAQGMSFVTVNHGEAGTVSAISADAEALNRLKTGIVNRLSRSLNGKATVHIPLGSFSNVGVLNGRGPQVPLKLNLEGSADVSFQTAFDSAGVNQSCHRIVLWIRAKAYSQSRRFELQVEETTSTVLAETVIIGEVPEVALTGH